MAQAVSLLAIPVPPPDTNVPDLHFAWSETDPNVTGFLLHCGQISVSNLVNHPGIRPDNPTITAWHGTDAYVTNTPLYVTFFWVTSTNANGEESVPSNPVILTNGYEFFSVTVTCNGTGNVYQTDTVGPWIQTKTSFHGIVGSWTNPPGSQLFKGPGMSFQTMAWNK
jgi:hypothetical protein